MVKQNALRLVRLLKGDITRQTGVDAIVMTVPQNLRLEGELNAAVVKAAGTSLSRQVLKTITKPRAGESYLLPGFDLPASRVIAIIMPPVVAGVGPEDKNLLNAWRGPLDLAWKKQLRRIAFPALCTGPGGFAPQRAARLAFQVIEENSGEDLDEIRIVCNREDTYRAFVERLEKLTT